MRNRQDYFKAKLEISQEDWARESHDGDFQVANYAVNYTRNRIKADTQPEEIARFIAELPQIAKQELDLLKIEEKKPLTLKEIIELSGNIDPYKWQRSKRMKVFGIGLGRTGTKSLTTALQMLNINVIHYPTDETTIEELIAGKYELSLLNAYDGITDITVATYYPQLDKIYPDSKFILTVRDKESWLKSIEAHWRKKKELDDTPGQESKTKLRRMLRSAVYGTDDFNFNAEGLSYIYDLHCKNVTDYFKDRPESLLIINIPQGEGWEKLCPFFDMSVRDDPFPSINRKL